MPLSRNLPSTLSSATSQMWLPRPSLSGCMRGVMVRNTLGVELPAAQRFNYFPASPLCSISWWFAGDSEMVPFTTQASLDAPRTAVPARICFHGPATQPKLSWNPGQGHGMMLLLMPDALHRLTGIEGSQYLDRFVDVRDMFPPTWLALCEAVMQQNDDTARVETIQDFLEPLWQEARPMRALQLHRYQDWAQSLALRAATSAPGRSLRQVERRIKQWAGLPMRELRGFGRAEQAFFRGLLAGETGTSPHWAELAESSGYADQSHLCRETRRITGFSPDDLYRRIRDEEAFWSYRLWK